MPTKPNLYANDLIDALKKKHAARGFKEMVIYVEACESGSIFEGLLPRNLNIYATTASNAEESSWGTYCPGTDPSPPSEYLTCLGDLYSVAWMEDSEAHNLEEETFKDQYRYVKGRTSNNNTYSFGSHVKQYGAYNISGEQIYLYMGSDPTNKNVSNELIAHLQYFHEENKVVGMHQRDADLLFLWNKFKVETEGSNEKLEAEKNLLEAFSHRIHLDNSVGLIGKLLFGYEQGPMTLSAVRPPRIPLVDNWACLKSMVRSFESHCGSLTEYGMKHMRAFANICNAGIKTSTFAEASLDICAGRKIPPTLNPIKIGFSA